MLCTAVRQLPLQLLCRVSPRLWCRCPRARGDLRRNRGPGVSPPPRRWSASLTAQVRKSSTVRGSAAAAAAAVGGGVRRRSAARHPRGCGGGGAAGPPGPRHRAPLSERQATAIVVLPAMCGSLGLQRKCCRKNHPYNRAMPLANVTLHALWINNLFQCGSKQGGSHNVPPPVQCPRKNRSLRPNSD